MKRMLAIAVASSSVVFGAADAEAGGNSYSNTGGSSYGSSRYTSYRQSSQTRSNSGGTSYKSPARGYRGHGRNHSYSTAGLTGSADYTNSGSYRNDQNMSYFSANSRNARARVVPVMYGDVVEENRNHPNYYRQFWRSRLK